MKKRVVLAAFIVAIVIVVLLIVLRPSEPSYHGKSARAWVLRYVESVEDSRSADEAVEAIRSIGTNGIPAYLKWVGSKDSPLKERIINLSRKQKIRDLGWLTAGELRILGRFGFVILGSNAVSAVPPLITLLASGEDQDIRAEAALALGGIGPAAQDAVPALIQCLSGTNGFAAYMAIASLGRIHSKPELAVPALIHHLEQSTNKPVHLIRSIQALGDFGKDARGAVPALTLFLTHPDSDIRSYATNSLMKISPETLSKNGGK
jgi:HEAT repeat protein